MSMSEPAHPRHGVVTAVESLAAKAGAGILRLGGNAADAAIAVAFAQGVVNPIHCGIGGSFHGLFFDATTKRLMAVSSGGRAPMAASATMFKPRGRWGATWQVQGDENRLGYRASMVPGFVRGARQHFDEFGSGKVSWAAVIDPAIALAEEGFTVYPYLYRLWMPKSERMHGFLELLDGPATLGHTAESRRVYLHEDGERSIGLARRSANPTTAQRCDESPTKEATSSTRARLASESSKTSPQMGGSSRPQTCTSIKQTLSIPLQQRSAGSTCTPSQRRRSAR